MDADDELVRRFQAGDRAAFDRLVERNVRLAGAVAYAVLGDYEQAADAVQDAFIKVHGALHGLREPGKLRTWLTGIVRTTAIDAFRRRRRAPGSLGAIDGAQDLFPDGRAGPPGAGLERTELAGGVLDAVRELPEQYREVVAMKYIADRSYEEISATLGISVPTIEMRLFRARKLLKDKLSRFAPEGGEKEKRS